MKNLFFILILLFVTQKAVADDYVLCTCRGSLALGDGNTYFSDIFLGDRSGEYEIRKEFSDYIEKQYGYKYCQTINPCLFYNSQRDAERHFEELLRISKMAFSDRSVMTRWKPDDSASQFTNQPLQDFNIGIDGNSSELEICVRDYECEDGDKIRVTVDGDRIFEGEIDNGWDCRRLDVRAGGRYPVELYAINGTGHKGNCSHRDENTGQIMVRGADTQTQSWRHRGGGGSSARIIVEAR